MNNKNIYIFFLAKILICLNLHAQQGISEHNPFDLHIGALPGTCGAIQELSKHGVWETLYQFGNQTAKVRDVVAIWKQAIEEKKEVDIVFQKDEHSARTSFVAIQVSDRDVIFKFDEVREGDIVLDDGILNKLKKDEKKYKITVRKTLPSIKTIVQKYTVTFPREVHEYFKENMSTPVFIKKSYNPFSPKYKYWVKDDGKLKTVWVDKDQHKAFKDMHKDEINNPSWDLNIRALRFNKPLLKDHYELRDIIEKIGEAAIELE